MLVRSYVVLVLVTGWRVYWLEGIAVQATPNTAGARSPRKEFPYQILPFSVLRAIRQDSKVSIPFSVGHWHALGRQTVLSWMT